MGIIHIVALQDLLCNLALSDFSLGTREANYIINIMVARVSL